MDRNTTAYNAVVLNNIVDENSTTAISPITNSIATVIVSLAKPFPNISKIEVFAEENFRRWQERIYGVLDMYEVAWVFTNPKTNDNAIAWTHGNKVCRHSILCTLSNELFNVYCSCRTRHRGDLKNFLDSKNKEHLTSFFF
jgi:hypothetical protein